MSVLIKGIELPKAGNWKTIRIYYDGTCAEPNWQGDCKYMKGCEAVPVPPHGDLIDRDALPWEYQGLMLTDPDEWGLNVWYIEHAPTIIPAEPPKEEV